MNKTSFYRSAFGTEQTSIWGFSDFKYEIENLCYQNAISCWIRDNEIAEEERRQLLYSYLAPQFDVNDDNSSLNKQFSILPTDNLQLKRVLRNLCIVYNLPPTREIEDEKLLELLDEVQLNTKMLKAHRIAKLTNEVAIRLKFVNRKPKIELLTPDLYRYKTDRYGNVTEIWIYKPESGELNTKYIENKDSQITRVVKFHVWTAEEFKICDIEGKTLESEVNPYGEIPYKLLKFSESHFSKQEVEGGSFWELVKAQLDSNKLTYVIDNNLIFTGFAMWTLLNFNMSENNLTFAPGQVLAVDGVKDEPDGLLPPVVDTVSADAQYEQIEALQQSRMRKALKSMELPPSLIDDNAGIQSGISMLIDRKALDELRREDIEVLRKFEIEFINYIARIANIDDASEYKGKFRADNYEITIDYAEMEVPIDPVVDYELLKQKYNDGLITPLQFVKSVTDIDIIQTNKEAIKYIQDNLRMKNESSGSNEQINAQSEAEQQGTSIDGTVAENRNEIEQATSGN